MDYYGASYGNFLPTFRDNLLVQSSGFKNSRIPEEENDWLSRKVGKKLPLLAA